MAEVYAVVNFNGGTTNFSALIDSGNSFRNLLSVKAFRSLNLPLLPSTARAVSVDNSSVEILGKTPLISLKFRDFDRVFQIQFEVINSMSVDCNLGYEFLTNHGAVLLFCDRIGNSMCIDNINIPLSSKINTPKDFVNTLLDDQGITFNDQVKDFPGINFTSQGEGVDISGAQRYGVTNAIKLKLPANSISAIRVVTPDSLDKGKVYFEPNSNKMTYVTKSGLLPLEAVYEKEDNLYINVVNTNEFETSLPQGCKVGFAYRAESICVKEGDNISSINELSTPVLLDRINFITKELGLKENPITKDNSRLRSDIVKIFLDNFDAVALSDNDVGFTNLIKFKIDLKEGATPVNQKNFALNPDQSAALRDQINNWLRVGVIRPTVSSWNSPIFSVKKKTAVEGKYTLRFVLDFRRLNEKTKTEVYPIPNIESNINKLGGAKLFSTLDAVQAYHCIEVEEDSQEFLAFSGEEGSYTFVRMPFGCKNSANYFQRLVNKALSLVPGIGVFCVSYLDDLIIFSNSFQNHLQHLQCVVSLLKRCGLKLKLSKCHIFKSKVKYLGHIVSNKEITMDPFYLKRVQEWQRPKTGKEMQSFLGFLNYYRSYLPKFAENTYRLDELRNDKSILWTEELNSIFERTKSMFHASVSRGYPDWGKTAEKFVLDIDFSKHCISGILSQSQNGKEVLIGAFSRKCSVAEARYSSHKGEACALVFALEKFSHFLRYRKFWVRTDSRSVLTTANWRTKLLTGVTSRWLEYIGTYDFDLVHRAGKLHCNADILSRTPTTEGENLPPDFMIDPITKGNSEYLDTIYNVNTDSCQLNYNLNTDEWVKATNLDPTLRQIKEWILFSHKPTSHERLRLNYRGRQLANILEHLSIIDGLIIFIQPTPSLQSDGTQIKRTVVPISLYDDVYNYAHNNAMTNHRGIINTLHFMQKNFLWFMHENIFQPGLIIV